MSTEYDKVFDFVMEHNLNEIEYPTWGFSKTTDPQCHSRQFSGKNNSSTAIFFAINP
jgi:hypothetical protein